MNLEGFSNHKKLDIIFNVFSLRKACSWLSMEYGIFRYAWLAARLAHNFSKRNIFYHVKMAYPFMHVLFLSVMIILIRFIEVF